MPTNIFDLIPDIWPNLIAHLDVQGLINLARTSHFGRNLALLAPKYTIIEKIGQSGRNLGQIKAFVQKHGFGELLAWHRAGGNIYVDAFRRWAIYADKIRCEPEPGITGGKASYHELILYLTKNPAYTCGLGFLEWLIIQRMAAEGANEYCCIHKDLDLKHEKLHDNEHIRNICLVLVVLSIWDSEGSNHEVQFGIANLSLYCLCWHKDDSADDGHGGGEIFDSKDFSGPKSDLMKTTCILRKYERVDSGLYWCLELIMSDLIMIGHTRMINLFMNFYPVASVYCCGPQTLYNRGHFEALEMLVHDFGSEMPRATRNVVWFMVKSGALDPHFPAPEIERRLIEAASPEILGDWLASGMIIYDRPRFDLAAKKAQGNRRN